MNNICPLGGHVFLTADLNHFLTLPRNVQISHKTAPLPGGHVFPPITTIFKLVRGIHITNTKLVTSRVKKTPPPPGSHVFLPIQTIIKLNLRSPSLTQMNRSQDEKNALPLGSHVFQAEVTIFELIQDIIGTNHLSKFHEDRKINVASRVFTRKDAPPPGGHVFQPTNIIFELVQDIIGMNLLTKFHEDRTINVASRVLTRFCYSHIRKNAPPLGSHVFQANVTIFKFMQDIIETNLLTKFHEDWTINVASRE
ncbi:hypothetical protein DPMN_035835 [Dreissena polymorpha]|uniref:Uncharacterized protein n=1 Tax=Dreissena polymorpha TaxID=45954 RepID=A0A9D4MAF6_DREPO|nr:hypothetical protein DPMN_035835 [Dreissena polymorpha]